MLICPIATKIYVECIVKTKLLNYTKYFCNVETLPFAGAVNCRFDSYIRKKAQKCQSTRNISCKISCKLRNKLIKQV